MIPYNTFTINIFYYHGNKQGSVLNVAKTKFKHTFNKFPEVYEKLYSGKVIHKWIIYTLLLSLTYEIINYQIKNSGMVIWVAIEWFVVLVFNPFMAKILSISDVFTPFF